MAPLTLDVASDARKERCFRFRDDTHTPVLMKLGTVKVVGATLANPSLNRGFRGRGKTAFERNLLPGFAHWMLDQLERREPDYLIPVETKGARVLEAVLRYARDELGEPLAVPVVYASALAYMDPKELAASRVVVVDDAVRTGGSLLRQRTRIERYGPTVIETLACVGDASEAHPEVDCYFSVEPDAYREYVWQLAELVVARGLPPEVDHHLFELQLPRRLEPSWWALRALLSDYGTLTIDGPDIEGRALQPLTLHFPELPCARGGGGSGPHKLRFFFDPANDCIYVVPVSFPPISLPVAAGTDESEPEGWRYPPEVARGLLAELLGSQESLGAVMLDSAEVLDPETIFAAVSTTMEFELIRGLKALLDRAIPGCAVRAQGDQFRRLYGEPAAGRVVDAIEEGLRDIPAAGEPAWPDAPEVESAAEETLFLDREVGARTRDIAEELRQMFERMKAEDPSVPPKRVGMSMPELTEFLGGDPLFASRCVDYGLAMTTLVPFVSLERPDGELLVERKYRISEPRFDESSPYVDMSDVREELSGEMLAAICHCVSQRSERYGDQELGEKLVSSLVGVLASMVCEEHSIELKIAPGAIGEQIILCSDDYALTLFDHDPKMLVSDGQKVSASPHFREKWDENELRLDGRNSTEDIEEHVALLIDFLDQLDVGDHERLLRAWAMCTDKRLGLSHVRSSLDAVIVRMTRAMKLVVRGEKHSAVAVDAIPLIEAARDKLAALDWDWAAVVRESWKDTPSKRHQRVLASLGAPEGDTKAYELPARLIALVEALAPLAEQINRASGRLWEEESAAEDSAIPAAAFDLYARVHNVLESFGDEIEVASPPSDLRDALVAAAEGLLDLTDRIRAFIAAVSGEFRGSLDDYRQPLGENKRSVSVLSVDIVGSGEHGRLHNGEEHRKWVSGALNVAAQWSRAFAGREGRSRVGDEVWIEFSPSDAPILAAAATLQHAVALRSTGLAQISWSFHAGVDAGELEDDHPANVISRTMDRVTGLAKKCDPKAEVEAVYLTPEAFQACSAQLHKAELEVRLKEVELVGEEIHPLAIEADTVMAAFCARLDELVPQLSQMSARHEVIEDQLKVGEPPQSAEVAAESASP